MAHVGSRWQNAILIRDSRITLIASTNAPHMITAWIASRNWLRRARLSDDDS